VSGRSSHCYEMFIGSCSTKLNSFFTRSDKKIYSEDRCFVSGFYSAFVSD
jgi:hypothetical protein